VDAVGLGQAVLLDRIGDGHVAGVRHFRVAPSWFAGVIPSAGATIWLKSLTRACQIWLILA
jgi:hypothetical protein